MTRINRLVLRGFKSFAKRTELVFSGDFGAILGPNGSGKSNLSDAITFVLGRRSSKAMRAEKSSNLIYNGGKTKKPAKDAEVAIHFDNKDKIFPLEVAEVAISRTVKHDGSSTYRINGKRSNRNDILDLLSHARIDPDGYNIIMQGDIVRFVEMATTERREIIEEITGIGAYEEKKQKSLRELERVDARLNEADIILTERKTYLKELKKDRDEALRFKDLNDNLLKNKATLLHLQIDRRSKSIEEFQKRLGDYNSRIEKVKGEIEKIGEKVKKHNEQVDKINSEIEKKGEKGQVKLNREIEQLKVDIATNKTRAESYENEIERIKVRREELEHGNKEILERIKTLEKEKEALTKERESQEKTLARLESDIEKFKKKNKFDQDLVEIEEDLTNLDNEADEKQESIQTLRQDQQESLREKDQIEFKIQALEDQMSKVLSLEKENKSQLNNLKNFRKSFKKAEEELNQHTDEDSSLVTKLSEARSRLSELNAKLAKLEAKSFQIKEHTAGDRAISSILARKDKIKGIHGTISELGKVQSKFSLALEIAAGAKIKGVVVDNDQVGAKCIKYLKSNKLGVATFLPLNKLRSGVSKGKVNHSGVHGYAIDLVDFDPKFKKAFEYVFGNTIVVEDIDAARKIGIGNYRMVTLGGDLLELSGAMRGGHIAKRHGLGFQQKELVSDLEGLRKTILETETNISVFEKMRLELDTKITKLREFKANLEGDIIKLEKTLHIEGEDLGDFKSKKSKLNQNLVQVDKKLDSIVKSISEQNKDLAKIKMERQALRDRINELRNPAVLAQLSAFEEKRSELKGRLIQLETELKNMDAQINTILGPDVKKSKSILDQNKKEESKFKELIKELKSKVEAHKQELKGKEKKAHEFSKKFRNLFEDKEKISKSIQKFERQIDEKEIIIKGVEQKVNQVNLDQAKIKGELAGFESEYDQFREVEIFKSKTDLQQLQREINRLEAKKENLGNVNLRALEVYETVEKEYNELLQKKVTLGHEKEDVLKMILEIESNKTVVFMKTFNVVNDIFRDFFQKLSTKGDAYLELENQENPFDAGVEIKVKLSANKFMDIKSLSGGEKTLTALAFIFAIQEHDPASFYILDEVDAALDKHNSEKFAQLVRSYCDRAQYLIISHNDAVISEATNLYGVAMDEHGISKITTLEL